MLRRWAQARPDRRVHQSGGSLSAFSIDPTSGALTKIGTANTTAGTSPVSIVVDPTGRFAYAVNEDDNTVQLFTIDSGTGALTAGATLMTGMAPVAIGMDSTGGFLFVANETSNDVWTFSINTTNGALTNTGATIAAGTTPHSCVVDPSASFVYVGNSAGASDSVSAYTIGTTGALTAIGSPVAAGTNPIAIAITQTIQ